jgi:hypothetical protein
LSVAIYGVSGVTVAASLTSAKGTKYPNTEKTVSIIRDGMLSAMSALFGNIDHACIQENLSDLPDTLLIPCIP